MSFVEALRVLVQPIENAAPVEWRALKSRCDPPESNCQRAAECIFSPAEDTLWSERGEPALNYLTQRGLTTRAIRAARLGYVPGDFREWRVVEGLEVPCGITIPWIATDALYEPLNTSR